MDIDLYMNAALGSEIAQSLIAEVGEDPIRLIYRRGYRDGYSQSEFDRMHTDCEIEELRDADSLLITDELLHAMETHGGRYVKSLSIAYQDADPDNRRLLYPAVKPHIKHYQIFLK